MKALSFDYRSNAPRIVDIPDRCPGAGDLLVRTVASAVSIGTEKMVVDFARSSLVAKARMRPDLLKQAYSMAQTDGVVETVSRIANRLNMAQPLGYSCAGVVIQSGQKTDIPLNTLVSCGGSGFAAHAEVNIVPRNLCVSVPDNISPESAAFGAIGSIALQAVRRAEPTIGERIGVIGLGLIGRLTMQILDANGCQVIGTDIDPWKVENTPEKEMATSVILDRYLETVRALTGGQGLDSVIIAASSNDDIPLLVAGEASRKNGRVVSVGVTEMEIPRNLYYHKEIDFRMSRSYGPGRYDPVYERSGTDYPFEYVRWTERRNIEAFLRLVSAGRVDPAELITHRFDLEDAVRAYELISRRDEKNLGIVLGYPNAGTVSVEKRFVAETRQPSYRLGGPSEHGIGLIGAGVFASTVLIPHLKRLRDIEKIGVASKRGISARLAVERHGFGKVMNTEEIMSDSRIGAVLIATSHESHADLVIQALEAGKHVFVEKPLAVNLRQLERLSDAIEGSSAMLQTGFNRRFSVHAKAARGMMEGLPATMVYRVNAPSTDSNLTGESGSIVGEVCHFIDTAAYVLNSVPISVASVGSGGPAGRSAVFTISFESGATVTIIYTTEGNRQVRKEDIECYSGGNIVHIDNFRKSTIYKSGAWRRKRINRSDKGYSSELDGFFKSFSTGVPAIPPESQLLVTRTTLAAVESLRSGSPVLL